MRPQRGVGESKAIVRLGIVDRIGSLRESQPTACRDGRCDTVSMLDRSTEQARQVVACAQLEARAMAHVSVEAVHLLLGLVQDAEGMAGAALRDAGIAAEPARDLVRRRLGSGTEAVSGGPLLFGTSARDVFASALRIAFMFDAKEVGSEHLLAAIIKLRDQDAAQILQALGADLDLMRFEIKRRALPRGEPGIVHGRSVSLSQTPWATDAPMAPDSPDRYTR
jgi:ATP-dependent Clp protease ATP-binding subunit ClpC